MFVNTHYYNRYKRFMQECSNRELSGDNLIERHHIIPRCIGGPDDPENLIDLTCREHYIAHWMLWKAYPEDGRVCHAFLAMCNKNFKRKEKKETYRKIRRSRTYARLKEEARKHHSERMKGWLWATDTKTGEKIKVSKEEYANQEQLSFHTTGFVWATDTKTGEKIKVSKEEYADQKRFVFHTKGKVSAISVNTGEKVYITSQEYQKNKHLYRHRATGGSGAGHFWYLVNNHRLRLTPRLAKRFKEEGKAVSGISFIDKEKVRGKLVAFDTFENCNKRITRMEYDRDPNRYITSTKGKVLATDKNTGRRSLVTQDEYERNNHLVGHTKGFTTVYNTDTQKYEYISIDEAKESKYTGPCTGKVNAISKTTGERKQIDKGLFYNSDEWTALGSRKYYFAGRHRKTGREKNIHIYEWKILKDEYEILDRNQFEECCRLL